MSLWLTDTLTTSPGLLFVQCCHVSGCVCCSGSVANMLVTSCMDSVCRIWCETILPDDGLLYSVVMFCLLQWVCGQHAGDVLYGLCVSYLVWDHPARWRLAVQCCYVLFVAVGLWPTCWWRPVWTLCAVSGVRPSCPMTAFCTVLLCFVLFVAVGLWPTCWWRPVWTLCVVSGVRPSCPMTACCLYSVVMLCLFVAVGLWPTCWWRPVWTLCVVSGARPSCPMTACWSSSSSTPVDRLAPSSTPTDTRRDSYRD